VPNPARSLTGGWDVSGILSFQTGQPFHAYEATPFACLDSIGDPMDDVVLRSMYRRPRSQFHDNAFAKSVAVTVQPCESP
jgi:hypothetical protein